MDISGTFTFAAPQDRVWTLLMDPDAIASCIPGCSGFEPDGPNRFKVTLAVALAAITGSYTGTVVLTDIAPDTSYTLEAQGQGRPGFVNGRATIVLASDGPATTVTVTGSVQTGGTIARLGQRLVGSVSQMMLERFFGCLQSKLT